jgi:serine phosphatase RsbU (regulator of sigma subunit)
MTMSADAAWLDAVEEVLALSHLWQPDQLADMINTALDRLGAQATIYQVDHEQRLLRPLPRSGRPTPEPPALDITLGGRAFTTVRSLPAGGEVNRWWVPIINGTDRLGVVEFVLADGAAERDPRLQARLEMFAGLVGHLLTTTEPRGDHLQRMRRSRPMSTAAELLLTVLPPLTASTANLVVSAVLEPCYEVGGDGYDYALDGSRPQVLVLDAVGRGLKAGLACVVVVSAIRAARRAGCDLVQQARAADAALQEQFPDARFATAVLAELDVGTGRLRYLNAGHPPPLLLRGGRFVRELSGGRRMPLGVDDDAVEMATETLEPGDRLLVYTDGVTEARDADGEPFGVGRLLDFIQRHAVDGMPAPETLRRLAHAVAAHQQAPPADDATLLLLEWSRAAVAQVVPDSIEPDSRPPLRNTSGSTS